MSTSVDTYLLRGPNCKLSSYFFSWLLSSSAFSKSQDGLITETPKPGKPMGFPSTEDMTFRMPGTIYQTLKSVYNYTQDLDAYTLDKQVGTHEREQVKSTLGCDML